MQFFLDYGFWGLGVSAFLSATLLPLSSELVLTALILANESPIQLVIIATVANVLGSTVNYFMGRWGADSLLHRWFTLSPSQITSSKDRFKRYGTWSLLFAWLPIIGDPLTFLAGVLNLRLRTFLVLVTLGKLARYILLTYLILLGHA